MFSIIDITYRELALEFLATFEQAWGMISFDRADTV